MSNLAAKPVLSETEKESREVCQLLTELTAGQSAGGFLSQPEKVEQFVKLWAKARRRNSGDIYRAAAELREPLLSDF
jgi:hypothetical protein